MRVILSDSSIQVDCWDIVHVVFWILDRFVWIVLCSASTHYSSSDGALLLSFAGSSKHNLLTKPSTSVVFVALGLHFFVGNWSANVWN